ncbi:DNA cytosine methyltransferase [Tessaracoccus lubricantis]|uniref:Cytosine-specific methyltransferase n=1 Tax=Tessaracoccus lubricantis TaxID=545543 RepID=A0ABP9F1L7_9ACTN
MGSLVDLFAGCGGMSLGMERAGFHSVFVNEISPHALSTYVRNQPADSVVHDPEYQAKDIHDLTGSAPSLARLKDQVREASGGDVDLVAGGPPCQGYSGIGHRRTFNLDKAEIPSNHLYREMARAVSALEPKAFIFENVAGLLTSKWTKGGARGEIWRAVLTEFKRIKDKRGHEYKVDWMLIPSKRLGVPQNRPRIILLGLRPDVAEVMGEPAGLLPPRDDSVLVRPPDPIEMLGDLLSVPWSPGGVVDVYHEDPQNDVQLALRTRRDGSVMAKGETITDQEFSRHSERVQERFRLIRTGRPVPRGLQTRKFNQRPIPRKWPAGGPTMTVASLPDDFVHFQEDRAFTVREWARFQGFPDWYEFSGPRTTGGRRRAGDPDAGIWERDLPKFTQIGNAVPVAMAEWLGNQLQGIRDL